MIHLLLVTFHWFLSGGMSATPAQLVCQSSASQPRMPVPLIVSVKPIRPGYKPARREARQRVLLVSTACFSWRWLGGGAGRVVGCEGCGGMAWHLWCTAGADADADIQGVYKPTTSVSRKSQSAFTSVATCSSNISITCDAWRDASGFFGCQACRCNSI